MSNNVVDHPDHYKGQKFECIDVMQEVFGSESVKHFCQLNAFKYLWRSDKKNGIEDIDKCLWYLNKYKELNMPTEHSYDVKFYIDGDPVDFVREGKIVFETVGAEDPEEQDLGKLVFEKYQNFMNAGFNANQAYGLTRDWFVIMLQGVMDNVEED